MRTYTNVVFDRLEQRVIETASRHLVIAFPEVNTDMPRKRHERSSDHHARVVLTIAHDPTQGTFENITQAIRVLEHLARVLARESLLDHWLDDAERSTGVRPSPSQEQTSDYQRCRMLAEARAELLADTEAALALLRDAAQVVTPRTPASAEAV